MAAAGPLLQFVVCRRRQHEPSAFLRSVNRRTVAAVRHLVPLVLVLLAGCQLPGSAPPETSDGRPKVLATFTVLADMTREVACGTVDVRSITKPGAEIHGYEFTPSDLRQSQGATLVLENGLGLEQWARRFTANLGNVPHVTLSDGVATLPIGGEGDDQDQRSQGVPNPHAWMSPKAARVYVANIRDALIRIDPPREATFRRCAERYLDRIEELDRDLASELARVPPDQRVLVTCEGAFSYLTRDYGLEEAWLWPVNGERQVTPQRMESVIRTVRQRKVPAVFCESTVDDRAQRRVAAETGARFAGTFHVDSLSGPDGPAPTYLELMRHNVSLLVRGLAPGADAGTQAGGSGR
jgi:manganese transport system substrate-binding protein